jgi:hypothetical protein
VFPDGRLKSTVDGFEVRIGDVPTLVLSVIVVGESAVVPASAFSSDPENPGSRACCACQSKLAVCIGVVDILLAFAANGDTLAGSSNGGITPSSLASRNAAAHTSFSASQDAASSKL